MPAAARPLSRKEAKLLTRHRLLDAAMAVLLEHGPDGLTTGRITQRAGVAQPTFYVHFRDMDELLRELATQLVQQLRHSLDAARAPLRTSSDLVAASVEAYRLSIRAAVRHAGLLRLFLAEQHRPQSTLGACGRQLLDELSADLARDLAGLAAAAGLSDAMRRMGADAVVALTLQFGLGLADRRYDSEDQVVELLARSTVAMMLALPQ
ncbi:TetR/AcrR family transcriptional regulator [Aquabacterium sp.]|uniref:TetR/AcrR family transcriptional regulator n=1 Tax=Aquabacterium sp. TaxID=1872578 RepID=UPI0035AE75A6